LQYLQGNIDSTEYSQFKVPDQRIQKGDQISVSVFSDNASASAMFNGSGGVQQPSGGLLAGNNGAVLTGVGSIYDVDQDGNIFFPQIGKLNVEGLTRDGLKVLLDSKLKDKYLINPHYTIRFLNLKITVFGDVKNPGIYPLVRENTNIFEALAVGCPILISDQTPWRDLSEKKAGIDLSLSRTKFTEAMQYFVDMEDAAWQAYRKGALAVATDYLRNMNSLNAYQDLFALSQPEGP
jgi:polysaccharide export outer membrane protein